MINATGVLLHTGLGRAPLAQEAIEAVAAVAGGYCSLELELEDGGRGRRTAGIERLVCELTAQKPRRPSIIMPGRLCWRFGLWRRVAR